MAGKFISLFLKILRLFFNLIKGFFALLLIFFLFRYFLIQPFIIDGDSMQPNFSDKEYLLVDKITYKFTSPKRGDVVILRPPNRPDAFYIKRIIGLPNEKIVMEGKKIVIYNEKNEDGAELIEPYALNQTKSTTKIIQVLQKDQYFVLGDNRDNSTDSREFGPVPRKDIAGRAFFAVFPLSKFGFIPRIKYPLFSFSTFDLKPSLLLHQLLVQN